MEELQRAFFAFWECGDVTAQTGSSRLFYRKIGARTFQFKKVDYKARTALFFEAMAIGKNIGTLLDVLRTVPVDADEDAMIVAVLPTLIGMLTQPGVQGVLDSLCSTASVDLGNGSFESLSEEHIGEAAFGTDLTLQVPVAATAALINFDSMLSLVQK